MGVTTERVLATTGNMLKALDNGIAGFVSQLPNTHKMDQIVAFFEKGKPLRGIDLGNPAPQIRGRGVVQIEDHILGLARVTHIDMAPGWRNLYLEFMTMKEVELIPQWVTRRLRHSDDMGVGVGGLGYTFDSNFPTGFQMRDFVNTVLMPQPEPIQGPDLVTEILLANGAAYQDKK